MKAYFRLLFAFIALGLVAAAVVGVVYVWENLVVPKQRVEAEIAEIKNRKKSKVDYGQNTYQDALTLLRTGQRGAAVAKLHELMIYYQDSEFYPEAKRIVGEINIDRLLSREPAPGKSEYIVESGDVLSRIASKAKSTVGYIIHVNNRMGSALQKGDQLIVSDLDFRISVNLSEKSVTLRTADDKFFKEYKLIDFKRPPNTPREFDTEISSLIVGTGARLIPVGTPNYVGAQKELRCKLRGVALRAKSGDPQKDKYMTGIFLEREDIEELALIIRPGVQVWVRAQS